jgi:hypothetical protein
MGFDKPMAGRLRSEKQSKRKAGRSVTAYDLQALNANKSSIGCQSMKKQIRIVVDKKPALAKASAGSLPPKVQRAR